LALHRQGDKDGQQDGKTLGLAMSSWERSRFIPWDRIPLPDTRPRGPDEAPPASLEARRELIFRQLQRGDDDDNIENDAGTAGTTSSSAATAGAAAQGQTDQGKVSKVPYSHMDLARQAAFGACIGSVTGAVFGFMDSMRLAGESTVLQNASNMAKGRYIMQGTSRSATVFGLFFTGYHITKYGLRIAVLPDNEIAEIAVAAPLSLGILMANPATRPALPYATMLVVMDTAHLYMRKTGS
jgi:hypothetical protein